MSARLQLPASVRRLMAARLAKPVRIVPDARRRRACIFKVDRLGDFVLALGALRHLVQHFGADGCRLVVSQAAAPLAAAEFPDVRRWELPAEASGVWREIRPLRCRHAPGWAQEYFDDLICLRHARDVWRDISLGWIHATAWHGLGSRPGPDDIFVGHRPVLARDYPARADAPWCRELLAHRDVLHRITGVAPCWKEMRPQPQSVRATAGDEWVFCPFGNESIRDYPVDRWITAWRMAELPEGPVRVIGPSARARELDKLAQRLRTEAGRARVGVQTNLPPLDFVACLARARGIITVESAAAHFATAFDKPAVVVLGGGHFGRLSPWGDSRRPHWLFAEMPCFGCNWQCEFPTVRCLVELPAERLARTMREAMTHG